MKQLTIVGAGWAGLSAAVAATQAGWHVQLFEATTIAGGRARSLKQHFGNKALDNGQHVLIGAYYETLSLMRTVGVDAATALQRVPLDLRFSDGQGLHLPDWPSPLNLLAGISTAHGWTLSDKARLIQAAWQWLHNRFQCPENTTVAQLCQACAITPRVMTQLIEPLCLSALNTPVAEASGKVFLRVLHDALMGHAGSSDLLIPRSDLGALLPNACLEWLAQQGAQIRLGQRICASQLRALRHTTRSKNQILLACPPSEAARLTHEVAPEWAHACAQLKHTSIATVFLHCSDEGFQGLGRPMMALHSDARAPAQFVFDKGRLCGQKGLLAAVISACHDDRETLATQTREQICQQLNLTHLKVVQTVVEKRATLACTPNLKRPHSMVAENIWACGDYIEGPYPSTLEGAVRSGQQVFRQLNDTHTLAKLA